MEDKDSISFSAKDYYDQTRMGSLEIEEEREEYDSRNFITSAGDLSSEIEEVREEYLSSKSITISRSGDHVGSLEIEEVREEYDSRNFITSGGNLSLEIEEVREEYLSSKSITISRNGDHVGVNDEVYVAVGKDDSDVVKWTLEHVVSPGHRVWLVHVYPPVTYIPTPVGKLSRSQLTQEQVRFYLDEEENRRRNLLLKYIELCNEAKVKVDTVLVEHNATAETIVDLISKHKITNLVMGIRKPPNLRILKKKEAKGEYVKRSAPDFCEVTIVYEGKRVVNAEKVNGVVHSSHVPSPRRSSQITSPPQRNLFFCACFSGKSFSV